MKFAAGTRDSITGKPYFFKSECGLYTVTIPANEALLGGLYGAWGKEKDKRGTLVAAALGMYPCARLAKEACEKHAEEHSLVSAA